MGGLTSGGRFDRVDVSEIDQASTEPSWLTGVGHTAVCTAGVGRTGINGSPVEVACVET